MTDLIDGRTLRSRASNVADAAKARAHQWKHDRSGTVEFIHINKTGGSSIEKALGLPFNHQTAAMRIKRLGREEWDGRYTFTFVRNPWDKLVSQYHFRKARGRAWQEIEFRDWIRKTLVDKDPAFLMAPSMFIDQIEWISDESDHVVIDDIYRYEDLHEEFSRLCRKLGVQASLPHHKPSVHGHYSEYYDDATADVVRSRFKRDIELFNYKFERR